MPFKNPLTRFPASGIIGQVASANIADELVGKIVTGGLIRTGTTNAYWKMGDDGLLQSYIEGVTDDPEADQHGRLEIGEAPNIYSYILLRSARNNTAAKQSGLALYKYSAAMGNDVTAELFGDTITLNGKVFMGYMGPTDSGRVGTAVSTSSTTPVNYSTGPSVVFTAPPGGRVRIDVNAYHRTNTAGNYCTVYAVVRNGGTAFSGTVMDTQFVLSSANADWIYSGASIYSTGGGNLVPGNQYNVHLQYETSNAAVVARMSTSQIIVSPGWG